jgi:hypothetical protein
VSERESVLEHNLRRLFARAWAPVAPRESFRAALERELVARTARRYGRAASAERARMPRWVPLAAAAAVVIALASFALLWRPGRAGEPASGVDTILARGDVAVRAHDAAWSAVEVPAGAARADLGRFEPAGEVATPSAAGAQLALGVGRLELGAWSRLSVADDHSAELSSGALMAELDTGRTLRLGTLAGIIELEGARAAVAYEPGPDGVVRIDVQAGIARVEDRPEWRDVAAGESARLRSGRVLTEPTAIALAPGERTEVAPPSVEPAAEAEAAPALSGSVTALTTGADGVERPAPVARFRVLLLEEVELPNADMPDVLDVEDEGGRFAFPLVELGTYSLFVQAEGFALARRTGLALGAEPLELAIELARGTTVRGTVVDARSGAAVSGAIVVSETDSPIRVLPIDRAALEELGFVRFVLSGPDGAFELEQLSRGRQVLRASEGGLAVAWSDPIELEGAAPLTGIELRLPPGGTVEGEVKDERGVPRAGVFLLASCSDFTKPQPCLSYKHTLTDEQGRYRIEGIPAGTVAMLLFGDPDQIDTDAAPDLRLGVVRAGATVRVDFAPPLATVRLEGRVVDKSGAPLGGRSLWSLPSGAEPTETTLISTTTNADGRFSFEGLLPGPSELFVSVNSPPEMVWLADVDLLPNGIAPVELTAGDAVLGGRVRAATTLEPVSRGVAILLEHPMGRFAGRVLLGEGGTFHFENVHPGRYDLLIEPADAAFGVATSESLELAAGSSLAELELLVPAKAAPK